MKRYLLCAVLVSVFGIGCASISPATDADYGKLESIKQVSFKKNEAFSKAMLYVTTKFESSKIAETNEGFRAASMMSGAKVAPREDAAPVKVIEVSDRETGIIVVKNSCVYKEPSNPLYFYYLNYRVTITVKDKKYRLKLEPLNWEYTAYRQTGAIVKEMAPTIASEFSRIDKTLYDFMTGKTEVNDNF